jgi:PAS domain S-box-containing protein
MTAMATSPVLEAPGLWRTIVENTFDGVMIVDTDRNVVYWNSQATRITGFTQAEVLGQNCLVGVRCPGCLRRCGLFTRGEICERTLPLITRSGREITVVKNAQLVRDAAGEVVGGIEVFHRLRRPRQRPGASEEENRILEALIACRWSRARAARTLGMSRATLWRKMKRYGI